MTAEFDYIIVGGGAAGCVLANRLSAKSSTRVLLLEAGEDTPPGHEPADVLDTFATSYYNKAYMWPQLKAHWRTRETSPAVTFDQARVMGGGSTVMGMVALRGTPDDYDEWEQMGATGWNWQNVLPYFRRLETDLDFSGDLHGHNGPVPIRRTPRARWAPLTRAIAQYALERQIPYIADMNGDFRDGYCSLPMSNTEESRASSAICYLDAYVRRRMNLQITSGAQVTGFVREGRRVTGVTVTIGQEPYRFQAREIILCAGGVHSPAMLLRAGIGPAQHLKDVGIDVVVDHPGVGANLQNHPLLFIGLHLRRAARQHPAIRPHPMTCFRYSSGRPGALQNDMYTIVHSKSSWNALGYQIGNITTQLLKPVSRGRVTLAGPETARPPRIEFNFVSEDLDLVRFMDGFRRIVDIVAHPAVTALCTTIFPVRFTDRIRRLNQLTRANALTTAAIAAGLDLMPGIARFALERLNGRRVDLAALVADDAALADHIRENVAGTFHVSGTCRMGSLDDPGAVVDSAGRVRMLSGLRIVDASIMPTVPRANTNIPVIMLAEKIADGINREGTASAAA
jgi:5-(hydroxymethyl)furfural/furfural oxidase